MVPCNCLKMILLGVASLSLGYLAPAAQAADWKTILGTMRARVMPP